MIPILFLPSSSSFATQGIGRLTDALSCVVTEARNGEYELEMTYPLAGVNFGEIGMQSIILAKPNTYDDPQPFRVYSISKPLDGICQINARHISYDLSGIPVLLPTHTEEGQPVPDPITATSAAGAFAALKSHSAAANPFGFRSDITTQASWTLTRPTSFRGIMGGVRGSILDVFGGEYHYNGYTVELLASRGEDRGFTVRYGKNLIDLEQEEECANCVSGVVAFYDSEGEEGGRRQGTVRPTGMNLGYEKILMLDATEEFEETPTVAQLDGLADNYISSHELTAPKVSLTVAFQQLDASVLERVSLCDTAGVYFEALGVQTTAKIVRVRYNTLLERYDELSLGSMRVNLADTIQAAEKKLAESVTPSGMQAAITRATDLITGNKGGYVVMIQDANGEPMELVVMDTPDITTATKVWRWNQSGLGYSATGYAGPYGLAMTSDGSIVADYINAGILQSGDGETFFLDLAGGILRMANPDISFGSAEEGYTQLVTYIDQTEENAESLEEISGYLRYTNGIVTIGDVNSQVALQVRNNRVSFYDTGTARELAYFSNDRLYISDATVTNSLDFGNYRLDTANGGVTFRWVG